MSACTRCGSTKNPPGSVRCLVCGAALSAGSSSTPSASFPGPAALVAPGGRRYRLSDTSATLVGSRGCAVLISGSGVEPQHCRLIPSGGGFLAEPVMGSVLLNGGSVTGPTPLLPGAILKIGSVSLSYSGPAPASGSTSPSATIMPATPTPVATLLPPAAPVTPAPRAPTTPVKGGSDLEGHIVLVDGPHGEDPDVDWAGLLLRASFGLILVPFICWQPALLVPFFLYGLGQRKGQTPARYLRVEDSTGKQYVVKMKGEPTRGMLGLGDDASFWGRWEGGTLMLQRALNHKTNAQVLLKPALQRRRNQIILIAMIGLILFLALGLPIITGLH